MCTLTTSPPYQWRRNRADAQRLTQFLRAERRASRVTALDQRMARNVDDPDTGDLVSWVLPHILETQVQLWRRASALLLWTVPSG